MTSITPIRATTLAAFPHGFLGREGGVSGGIHAGLNVGLGSDDDRDHIKENRRRAVAAVAPGAALVTLHQIHSADAIAVDAPYPDDARPHADALVTDRPGLLLGILTADCVPVLLGDPEAGVVGAAHAGWKGALGGVTDASPRPIPRMNASSLTAAGQATINSTSRPMWRPASPPPASTASRRSASIPMRMRAASSASAAPLTAAKAAMAGRFR
jgi:hypothetical protein